MLAYSITLLAVPHMVDVPLVMAPGSIGFLSPCILLSPRRSTAVSRTPFTGVRFRSTPVRPQVRICAPIQNATRNTISMSATAHPGKTLVEGMITLFPIWAVGASILAYQSPSLFTSVGPMSVRLALAGVMLSTGLTLTRKELSDAAARPVALTFGLLGCFVAMPAIAWMLAYGFGITGAAKAGLLLVGVVSGGQMSNLCTHISHGDTALSVAMTTASTLAAAFALPALAKLLLQATVPVDAMALAISTGSFVLAPVLLGAALSGVAKPIRHALPLLGIVLVLVLIVGPVAQTASVIAPAFRSLALPVTLLHLGGGLLGYVVSKIFRKSEAFARAMAFETGFKSPALSFVLAQAHFADPGVALASAVSIVMLAPLGALFAVLLRFFPPKEKNNNTKLKVSTTPVAVRARRLQVSGNGVSLQNATNTETTTGKEIDTRKLRLKDEEILKVDQMNASAWKAVPNGNTSSAVAPNAKTKFMISIQNRKPVTVHFGALSSKLNLLRKRGLVITEVQRLDGMD